MLNRCCADDTEQFLQAASLINKGNEDDTPVSGGSESQSLFGSLLKNIKVRKLETDDFLLLAILYLMLRNSEDTDVMLIIAVLFFAGFFD